MYKELLEKVKKAKNSFAWVMINDDDGAYIYVSKKQVIHLIKTNVDISEEKFVLREDGDLYIN